MNTRKTAANTLAFAVWAVAIVAGIALFLFLLGEFPTPTGNMLP